MVWKSRIYYTDDILVCNMMGLLPTSQFVGFGAPQSDAFSFETWLLEPPWSTESRLISAKCAHTTVSLLAILTYSTTATWYSPWGSDDNYIKHYWRSEVFRWLVFISKEVSWIQRKNTILCWRFSYHAVAFGFRILLWKLNTTMSQKDWGFLRV